MESGDFATRLLGGSRQILGGQSMIDNESGSSWQWCLPSPFEIVPNISLSTVASPPKRAKTVWRQSSLCLCSHSVCSGCLVKGGSQQSRCVSSVSYCLDKLTLPFLLLYLTFIKRIRRVSLVNAPLPLGWLCVSYQ